MLKCFTRILLRTLNFRCRGYPHKPITATSIEPLCSLVASTFIVKSRRELLNCSLCERAPCRVCCGSKTMELGTYRGMSFRSLFYQASLENVLLQPHCDGKHTCLYFCKSSYHVAISHCRFIVKLISQVKCCLSSRHSTASTGSEPGLLGVSHYVSEHSELATHI